MTGGSCIVESSSNDRKDKIKDNGIGIDLEKHKHKLFKPFTRFTNKADGKGLGLHIIKSMVEKNGGRVEIESRLSEGTQFHVYLVEYENISVESNS